MSLIRTIGQPVLRSCTLLSFAFSSIVVNVVEVTLAGMILAGIAMLVANNVQSFREYPFLFFPLTYTVIFLLQALPGFFTVIFMSKLMGRNHPLAATVFAVVGALIWLTFASFVIMSQSSNTWIVVLGLVGNAVGQVWAAKLVGCAGRKDSCLPIG